MSRSLASTFLVVSLLAPLGRGQETPEAETPAPEATTAPAEESAAELVSVDVLEARLRPMTKDEVQAELDAWLALLKQKCQEVSEVEIQTIEGAEDESALAERAVELRNERGLLIARVDAVISALEDKGGDVEDAQAYVDSVVVTPPVTGMRAAWTTVRAWMTSSEGGVALAKDLGIAAGILLVAWILARFVSRIVDGVMHRARKVSELLRKFSVTAISRIILFFGLLLALSKLGLNMGPMLAAIGALGLVVGLALQGTLSNFASGLMIMVYRPFDIGDVLQAAGTLGKVEGMTLVTTTVKTLDNQRVSIPNNMIWGDVITNLTAEKTRRIDMKFGIGYGDDVGKAKDTLTKILKEHERVLDDPEPNVQVHELGDSSVNFVVRPWVKTADYWDVYWEITRSVKERFDAEGISIPFPQRDIHVYHESGDELQFESSAETRKAEAAK